MSQENSTIDSTHSIMRSALRFLSGTAVSRMSGMIRDMVLAFSFGTNAALAALFVAFRLSHVVRRLFGEGALQSAFIPLFEELRKESPQKAFTFFRDISALWALGLTMLSLITMMGLWCVNHTFSFSESTQEILSLMIILTPGIVPICLFGLNSSLLQCEKQYFTIGVAPALFNATIIGAAFSLSSWRPEEAVKYVAAAIVVGCVFQWLLTVFPIHALLKNRLTTGSLFKDISLFSSELKRLWKPLSLGLLGIGASQVNNAIDSIFARCADPEGPAQLWFGLRLQQVPLAFFGIALAGAVLPPLSRALQIGNTAQYLNFLEFALRRVFSFLFSCSMLLFVLGLASINAIYGRGDFQDHSILTTTACLHGYTLALLPMGWIMVLAPAFYAKKNYRVPTIGAVISLVINLLLNSYFVFVLHWNAVSIAIATALSAWVNTLYLSRLLAKEHGSLISHEGRHAMLQSTISVLLATATTWMFISSQYSMPTLFLWCQESVYLLPKDLLGQMTAVALPASIFIATLLIASFLLKARDITHIFTQKKER